MADLAIINHWPLSAMMAMDLIELIEWRRRAVERWRRMYEGKSG